MPRSVPKKKAQKYFLEKLRIHNLICLEKKLFEEGRSGDAFTIRQVLDMIKPSWRKEAEV